MIERLLERLAAFALGRPRAIFACGLLAAALSLYAFTVPVDLSFAGVMNRSQPEVARYFAASERYGLGGILPVLLEGPEERLDEAVREARRALGALDEVRTVLLPPPRDWLVSRAPFLVEAPVFDDWIALAEGPPSVADSRAILAALEAMAARWAPRPPPGERLVTVVMSRDSFELALDADDFPVIRRTVEETLAPLGVAARFAGMPAIVTQEREATLERLRVLGPLSLVLVLAILLFVERRPAVLASIALPMLLSIGCTLALIGWLAGELTLMESIFGVLVFGLGIDVAIHLLLRMRAERAAGRDFETALHRAIAGTGRGVVAGAVTTTGAFAILAFSPDPVFRRLGLAGALGLGLCLLFLLAGLPAAWRAIESRRPAPVSRRRAPGDSWLGAIAGACSRRPVPVLVAAALVLAAAAWQMRAVRYETDLERVFSEEIDAVATARRIHALFGIDPSPWLVAAEDLETARRLTEAFEQDPTFGRVESLALVLRADADERGEILGALAPELARRLRAREVAALAAEGDAAEAARAALEPLALLLAAQALGPPRRETLPAALVDRWVGPDGALLVYAFPAAPALDSAVAARERRAAQAIAPEATSMSALYEALIGTDRPWLVPIVIAVVVFIAGVVTLDLRSVRLAVLALVPVSAALVATVGGLTAAGFSFNTVTLVAVPMLLGLGVDDGIHTVHRMLEQPAAPLRDTVGAVAQSIAMTTATTCASVGLLLFTRHPGIESVALLLLAGLPTALLATVTLLPAAAVVLGAPAIARRRAGQGAPVGERSSRR